MNELVFPVVADDLPGEHRRHRHSLNYLLGRLALRHYALAVALILMLAVMNCFWRLSSSVISDLDEARYGVAASEMLHNHSALVATYAGKPEYWNLKPPLGYWMQELSYKAFGPTVFALRFPAALCTLMVIALTMSTCKHWYGRRPALLAGLMLTTCFGLVSHHGGRSGDLDSALTLIMLVAVIQVPRLVQSSVARLLWAGMFALGFLLKSFAILPFVAITMLYLLCSGDWRRTRGFDWLPAIAVLSSIVLAWVLARCWVDGSVYFVSRMFHEDLIQRSTRVIDVEIYKPWGYVAVLLDRFAPWPMFILAATVLRVGRVVALRGFGTQQAELSPPSIANQSRLIWLWALAPLLAFSLVRTQHHWYLDPTYPAWSILAACASLNLMALGARRARVIAVSLIVIGLMFCETRILFRVFRTDRRPAAQAFLLSLPNRLRLPADTIIVATFPLSHSERFILQVVDGYRVHEPDVPGPGDMADAPDHAVLLERRQQAARIDFPRASILAAGAGYLLLKK
jgi:4-amino-4-deoxy-L-arabinose transferase-like glycosyltransferase